MRPRLTRSILVTTSIVVALSAVACSDTSGPAVAVELRLYSIDGMAIPAPLKSPGGRTVSIGTGRLQGTNRGYACGMSVQLIDGPVTAIDVPECRLFTGEDKLFKVALTDSRFPAGLHEYRFIP